MDGAQILDFLSQTGYFLVVFGVFFLFAVLKGRQAVINIIVGLYLALLITLEFPNYEALLGSLETPQKIAAVKLALFAFIALMTTLLCYRIMPDEFREERFESIFKKILLALSATILVMIFSFQVLPVSELVGVGSPIQLLFAPEVYFFWWLLVPLVALYLL